MDQPTQETQAQVEQDNFSKVKTIVVDSLPTASFRATRKGLYFSIAAPIVMYLGMRLALPLNVLRVPISLSCLVGGVLYTAHTFRSEFTKLAHSPSVQGKRLRLYLQHISKDDSFVPFFGEATKADKRRAEE